MDKNFPKYMISIASEMLGLHPQTLRQYERLGLIVPSRVDGKNRLYSENDIEKLQFIKTLTQKQGVNLAGVEIILNMQEQIILLNKKILQIESNMQLKYGENISIMDNHTNNFKTIKIEKENKGVLTMINYNKMTIKAQEAIQDTVKLAENLSHQMLQVEHLAYAILTQQDGLIRPLLQKLGVNPDITAAEIKQLLTSLPKVSGSMQPTLSPDAQKAIDYAFDKAKKWEMNMYQQNICF